MTGVPEAASPSSPCGSWPPATAASSPCSTARTSCSPSPSAVEIAHFPEATRAEVEGPYDVSLVEGSVTTEHDARAHPRDPRRAPGLLVTIGACATAGGIQALRNFADVKEFTSVVYARPEYISTLATSTPISAHVPVDFELRGCPIDKRQLLEVITALLAGRKPADPDAQRLHRVQAARQRRASWWPAARPASAR